jgi:hypothetical protein
MRFCIVPVWGQKYVNRWLDRSLPSLLLPGNLPALEPSTFVIVTRQEDVSAIEGHPRFADLSNLCPVVILPAPNLTDGTSMTAAHEMGLRFALNRCGHDPTICFLNADMVFADGTYRTVRKHLDEGRRGVMAQGIPTRESDPDSRDHLPQWKSPFPAHPSQLFWPDGEGLLMHCWHLYPLAIRTGSLDTLKGTVDNDLAERCCFFDQLAFIQDSKDGGFVSLEDDPAKTWGDRAGEPDVEKVARWAYGCSEMQRRFFALPFRFGEVSPEVEKEAQAVVQSILTHDARKIARAPVLKPTKALFVTTQTNEVDGHVAAWDSFSEIQSTRITYDHNAQIRNDWRFTEAAEKLKPDVIFYIGACKAPGNPAPTTLAALRKFAPLVNLCSDAGDHPWHPVLDGYRRMQCFDLQVSIDGALHAPVDFATLTPVDTRRFEGPAVERDIRCGFSGSVGRWNARSEIILALKWFGGLTVRERDATGDGYQAHVDFLKRCRMVINLSFTGTQQRHHIKGRVVEAGWAGACLIEYKSSPIIEWFPRDCYLMFSDPVDAARIIRDTPDEVIERTAANLAREVRNRFTPRRIYGDILERVALTQQTAAA